MRRLPPWLFQACVGAVIGVVLTVGLALLGYLVTRVSSLMQALQAQNAVVLTLVQALHDELQTNHHEVTLKLQALEFRNIRVTTALNRVDLQQASQGELLEALQPKLVALPGPRPAPARRR